MKGPFRKHMRAFVIVLCATCILAFAMERSAGAGTLDPTIDDAMNAARSGLIDKELWDALNNPQSGQSPANPSPPPPPAAAPPPPSATAPPPAPAAPPPPQPQIINNANGYGWDPDTGRLSVMIKDGGIRTIDNVGPGGAKINWATGIEGPPDILRPSNQAVPAPTQGQANTPDSCSTMGQQAGTPPADAPKGASSDAMMKKFTPSQTGKNLSGSGTGTVAASNSGGQAGTSQGTTTGATGKPGVVKGTGGSGKSTGQSLASPQIGGGKSTGTASQTKVTNVSTGKGASSGAGGAGTSGGSKMLDLHGKGTSQPVANVSGTHVQTGGATGGKTTSGNVAGGQAGGTGKSSGSSVANKGGASVQQLQSSGGGAKSSGAQGQKTKSSSPQTNKGGTKRR